MPYKRNEDQLKASREYMRKKLAILRKDPEKWKEFKNEYRERNRRLKKRYKTEVFKLLGNKCTVCGISDFRVLQIDHIHGNGNKDKNLLRTNTRTRWKRILDSVKRNEGKYQLLCANCNWIKRYENKEYNHLGGVNK